jgi:hypothetical protein
VSLAVTTKTTTSSRSSRSTAVDKHNTPPETGPETRARRVDWSWRHGPILGPVNAAGGTVAVAMVADLAQVSWWWPAVGGVAAAVAATARAAHTGASRLTRTYQQTCWAGAGASGRRGAVAGTPWSGEALAVLAASHPRGGPGRPGVRHHEQRVRHQRQEAAEATPNASPQPWTGKTAWNGLQVRGALIEAIVGLARCDRIHVAGASAAGRHDVGALASHADGLRRRRPARGMPGRDRPRRTRGVVLIRVATVDTTVQEVPYPQADTPLS